MTLQHSVSEIINQLIDSLQVLSNEQYCKKIPILSYATIGHHVRHVIEMFILLEEGYVTGTVHYDHRKRDPQIESSREVAITNLKKIVSSLHNENKNLIIEMSFDKNNNQVNSIPGNYYRELMYNLEHAIHHMALIKIGINTISDLQLPSGFGVAFSTTRYQAEKLKAG